ncbi:MAG TPA: glycoside hydrolase, partial [Thermoanaerobaculia bacterium]|nr:glycoside hydrolase [Thermoanaerobaculia bacterium]
TLGPEHYAGLRWRMIGPHRGGRTVAASGVPGKPNVFYMAANNGGVWKSDDYGRVWMPIFDEQPTGSIGAIAIAPSDPNTIYVGTGEGLQRPDLSVGDGMYKSTDAGKSWTHLGLRDGQQIPMIAVDPRDANRLFVAVLGHPYGANTERGIYRSNDGGKTFDKVLYRDENTGAIDVVIDPAHPDTVYAALWEARQGPWENGAFRGPGSGLFKSTDGGTTWRQLTNGLPAGDALGRIGIEICAADPNRLYAIAGTAKESGGVYRSDDGGESWRRINDDERLWGRPGDFNEVRADPKNPDVVYVANIVTWKSTDGGKTFASFRGAPGGDDYHRIWINPNDTRIILIASDQGAIVTVNGGESWSSWYNQPTAQLYHVSADNDFPYRVCGGQQESGSACVQSRSDDGRITFREWHPAAAEEYGYVVPDPLDPNIVYGGKISRYDRRTDQAQDISPRAIRDQNYRVLRTMPIVFSPVDPHILYFASNTLWKTTSGGKSWTQISPDLTRKDWAVPTNVGKFATTSEAKPKQRGVIYAVAPSPLDINRIWAGTDDGLIHVTTDGGATWKDITPKALVPWSKVSILEASHFDAKSAYAAINTFRLDDLWPHIYRTRDGGATWTHITSGIPDGAIINVVREDPKTRGLLFAGSENAVYVSFDDGDHWQSLRLNMPATSIRDLIIHGDDIAVATHGRGFWILDDIEPLRQLNAKIAAVHLFKPQRAWRYRSNKNTDTPLPPDEPAGQNPPDGAIIDYYLTARATGLVTLEILDANGKLVRRYTSEDAPYAIKDEGNVPKYWIRPPRVLSTEAGMHRFVWDLHYTPLPRKRPSFSIAATPGDTAPDVNAPWVMPGTYSVRLTANGTSVTQPLVVAMDPRVKTSPEDLREQFDWSMNIYTTLAKIGDVEDSETPGTLGNVASQLRRLLDLLQDVDAAPTTQALEVVSDRLLAAEKLMQ